VVTRVPAYWDYLHLDRLLSLQGGIEGDDAALAPDELHFIVVHQVFELWFKLTLRELRLARNQLAAPRVPEEAIPHVVHHLRRTSEIIRQCVGQFRIMESLTPQDFLAFRDKLVPASGFQSFQMREIELLLGLEDAERFTDTGIDPLAAIEALAEQSDTARAAWGKVQAAREEQTLRSALHDWLYRTPIQGSSPDDEGDAQVVATFVEDYLAAMARVHEGLAERFLQVPGSDPAATQARLDGQLAAARSFLRAEDVAETDRAQASRVRAGLLFVESYRKLPLLAWPRILVDMVVELEETLVLFRTRHARMVERVIGRRLGTGGSSGVDYLDKTTRYRIFKELWSVRTLLLAPENLPPLLNPELYGFAS
jgi:tryptophan 2,3-dioxygenase